MICPHCKRDGWVPEIPPSKYLPVPAGWKETVEAMRHCIPKEKEFATQFLFDMSVKEHVSERQWKTFCGIHKDVFSKWPPGRWPDIRLDALKAPAVASSPSTVVFLTDEELAKTF